MTGSWANLFSFSTRGAQVGAGKSEAEDFLEAVLEVGLPLAGDLGGRSKQQEGECQELGGRWAWAGEPGQGPRCYEGSWARGAGNSGFGVRGQSAGMGPCGSRGPGCHHQQPWLRPCSAKSPPSVSLGFPICDMRVITVPTSWDNGENS